MEKTKITNLNNNIMKTKYEINAVANEKTKTFDIFKTWSDGEKVIYRTTELTDQEFNDMEYNTSSDWQNFLNTNQNYYRIDGIK